MTTPKIQVALMIGFIFSGLQLISCGTDTIGESRILSEDSYVSYYDPAEITATYTINDGFFVSMRRAAVIVRLSKNGKSLKYDEGTKVYANGEELPFYDQTSYMRYSAFIDLDENATSLTITTLKNDGSIVEENIELAQRVELTNYNHNDVSPDLMNESLTLNYSPAVNTHTNINVGGGECSNHYDTASDQQGSVTFNQGHLNNQDLNNYTSGEKIHFRVRNQKLMGPPQGFSKGKIESNGFKTFDLIVP